MVELSGIQISPSEVKEFLTMSNKLLYFKFDSTVGGAQVHERHIIQKAVEVTNGRTLIGRCYEGVYKFDLPRKLQQNQDASMEKVEKA